MQGAGVLGTILGIIRFMLVVVIGLAIVLLIVAATSPESRAAFSDGVLTGIGETISQLPDLIRDIRGAA